MNRDLEDLMQRKWYAKPNDLIGGWCVMPIDKTPGELTDEDEYGHEIADFTTEEIARYIADLHNQTLEEA